MNTKKPTIQQIFIYSFLSFLKKNPFISAVQKSAGYCIMACRTVKMGFNKYRCSNCGHISIHYNSCRNRNCPCCQSIRNLKWVETRRQEVIDAPYFHIVETIPHELNPLFLCNQKSLYDLFHKCSAETLLELSADKKYLGAKPGIIQVLQTWSQTLKYHVHMHCIISGGGITKYNQIKLAKRKSFFLPVKVVGAKLRGKFMMRLDEMWRTGKLEFSAECEYLKNSYAWKEFKDHLYTVKWVVYIKKSFDAETRDDQGNAIDYLGHYVNKIAISDSRLVSVTETETTFTARGIKQGDPRRTITLSNEEFIRRYLMHVLPKGFVKVRYFGFLNNRMREKYLKIIFYIQNRQRFRSRFEYMTVAEIIQEEWHIDVTACPVCGKHCMKLIETAPLSKNASA